MAQALKMIGKYHILDLLAQGGMAEVYKAKTIGIAGFEKVLALKRIRPRYARQERFIRNFIDEARIAVALNHRNIVQVFDFGKAEGELYLAMELLDGVDLRVAAEAAKARGEVVPPALACYILSEVAAGLDHAHRKCDAQGNALRIVHCDVSPHNVLLSHEGFVKILDFGVARAKFTAAPTSKRLRGKPRYMAPEQTRGEAPMPESDVFVVGILAWELLAGKPLFVGSELKQVLHSVRNDPIPALCELNPTLPKYLSDAIATALHRDPKERGTASQLRGILAQASRELGTMRSAQALSEWLLRLFPPPPEVQVEATVTEQVSMDRAIRPPTEPTEVTVTRPRLAIDQRPTQERTPRVETTGEIADVAPSLAALIDKRRVVVTVLLLSGGDIERRHELSLALDDLAYKRGAVVHERSDEEVVAIFGLEVAGDDNVASAMHFSLDACELAQDTVTATAPVMLRSCARAGVVAERRGGDYHLRGEIFDEARDLAREAEPNRPLLSGGTGKLASVQFHFRELPARRYGNRRVRVLELLGPRGHDDRVQALRQRSGRFVGREAELAQLWRSFGHTRANQRARFVLVAGPAGVGKSRLVAEFVARVNETSNPPHVVAVAAMETAAAAPFTVAVEYLQAGLQVLPGRGETARAELVGELGRLLRASGVADEEVRESCASVERAMELRDGSLSAPAQASVALRERFSEAVRHFRRAIANGRASVTIIENLHLADAASLDVLHLVMKDPMTKGLVVATSRLTVDDPFVDETMTLGELSGAERTSLIQDRLAGGDSETVGVVARRAGGNPLYIEELCRAVREVGIHETPITLRDTIVARVDALSPRSRAMLQRAAVIGANFRSQILEELVAGPVDKALQECIEEGLIIRVDQADLDAKGGLLVFRHELIQEVVYESLSLQARQNTHARLGRLLALRVKAGRDEPPAVIARHLELGGFIEEATVHWTRAGAVCLAALDARGAHDAFDRAITLHRSVAGDDEQDSRYIDALFGRAQACEDLGDMEGHARDLKVLAGLCADESALGARLANQQAARFLRQGDYDAAVTAARRAVVSASAANAKHAEGEALHLIGQVCEHTGLYETGFETTMRANAIFDRLGATGDELRSRIAMAHSHLIRGRLAEARGMYLPMAKELERHRDPRLLRLFHGHLAKLHAAFGEYDEAFRHLGAHPEAAHELIDEHPLIEGAIWLQLGQYSRAKEILSRASSLYESARFQWSWVHALILLADTECALAHVTAGIAIAERALLAAETMRTPFLVSKAGICLSGAYLLLGGQERLKLAEASARGAGNVAGEATLHAQEAIAWSRHGEALRRLGALPEALGSSQTAVHLLDRLRGIEGCEEEILYYRALALRDSQAPTYSDVVDRAMSSVERKLEHIVDEEWRQSFCEEVPVNNAIAELAG